MSLWEALLLGLVQGATEFLPVSSSGHLVMSQVLLGIDIPGVFFEVAVHVATLVSVLFVYRARVGRLVGGTFRREADAVRYVGLLLLATIPAGFVGVLFEDRLSALFDRADVVGVALLVTGALLWSTRAARRRRGEGEWARLPGTGVALAMGFGQAFAIVPGISRSGTTVVVALWLGLEAREAAAFSFLMSVPAIAGAAVLKAPELVAASATVPPGALVLGALAAGVSGVAAIRTFVAMLEKRSFHHFAVYCWLVGGAFLAYLFLVGA